MDMKGIIVRVGSHCSAGEYGWLTTERSESSYGLPVFLWAGLDYEPLEPAMSAQELTIELGGKHHQLAYCGLAEWIDDQLFLCPSESSNDDETHLQRRAVEAGFQFGPAK